MFITLFCFRYTIVSGDKTRDFTIGEHSGVLRVNRKLEFERKNAYQLTIQVKLFFRECLNCSTNVFLTQKFFL